MRKFSAKIGVAALSVLAAFAISVPDLHAAPVKVNCNKAEQTIQQALADAVDGDIITVSGTCTEIVTITTDGITIIGKNQKATLMGGVIVDGVQRVVIDTLTIDGSMNTGRVDGVLAENNAHVTVRNSTIVNHTRSGVNVTRASSALIEGNTVTVTEGDGADSGVAVSLGSFAILRGTAENPTQTITSDLASNNFGNSLAVNNSSHARLNGGNTIEGTGAGAAIGVFGSSEVRLHNGLNTVLGTGGRAIDVGRLSVVTLRWFDVTGQINIDRGSHVEIRKRLNIEPEGGLPVDFVGTITGDIRVKSAAHVNFNSPFIARNLRPGGPTQGSVTVNGRLFCFGDEGHMSFGTGFGQTIQLVFPSQADREASQCNNFNGFPVLPVFGP